MGEVLIRQYRPADLDGLFVLDYRAYPPAYRFGYSQLAHTLHDKRVSAVVIEGEREGDLVGGLIVRADPEARLAAVVSLTVEPDYRRHGLGTRLLDWAVRYAEASAWLRVVVPLERGNEGAAAFLTAAGFEDSGLSQPYYHSAGEGTLWRLNLKTEQPE